MEILDTEIIWKFNGHDIQGNTNKKNVKMFLDQKRGNFSLYIKTRFRKKMLVIALVSGRSNTHDDEDYIKLSLEENGVFTYFCYPQCNESITRFQYHQKGKAARDK